MKNNTQTKTGADILQDNLLRKKVETEITTKVDLIRSVMIQVENMRLTDPTNIILIDIEDYFNNSVTYFCEAYDELINLINEQKNEKS